MKRISCLLTLLVMVFNLSASNHVRLPRLLKPQKLKVQGNFLYIAEPTSVTIYKLNTFEFVKKFGRKGEGPGDFISVVGLFPAENRIVVNSFRKTLVFSKDGEFISEKRLKKPVTFFIHPIKDKYIAAYLSGDVKRGQASSQIAILDTDLNPIKIILEKDLTRKKRDSRNISSEAIKDFHQPRVFEDRVYIGNTANGFFFEVFDSSGNRLYTIDNEYEKIKITPERQEEFKKKVRGKDGFIRNLSGRKIKYSFRDYFPAYWNFMVLEGRIYVFTHKRKNGKNEVVILDLKGNELKRAYITMASVYTIGNGKYYYLKDNADTEEWELHWENLHR